MEKPQTIRLGDKSQAQITKERRDKREALLKELDQKRHQDQVKKEWETRLGKMYNYHFDVTIHENGMTAAGENAIGTPYHISYDEEEQKFFSLRIPGLLFAFRKRYMDLDSSSYFSFVIKEGIREVIIDVSVYDQILFTSLHAKKEKEYYYKYQVGYITTPSVVALTKCIDTALRDLPEVRLKYVTHSIQTKFF